jgi:uncharacterized protein (TIGR02996 family)
MDGATVMPQDALAGFYLALRQSPGDPVTLLALADYYEEQGQPDKAACVRWSLRRQRHPFEFRSDLPDLPDPVRKSPAFKDCWFWWARDGGYGADWGHPQSCRLPEKVWEKLKNLFETKPLVVKHFPTVQAAYEALFEVWPRFAPAERESW